jgi:hypothetical protein
MVRKIGRVSALVAVVALVVLCAVRAEEAKPSDEGKAADFKGKKIELKEKGSAAIVLTFTGGKEAVVTAKGEKKSDVNLYVYDADKKEVGKDDSPGPDCEVKFTPAKDGKYRLLLRNLGPGENTVNLTVKVAD